jgi:hypothetical protein
MTIREALLGISAYPIPLRTVEATALRRAVDLDAEARDMILDDPAYRLCVADLYVWLYFAPNVGQGGQSYSFTDSQREWWKRQAMAIYDELDDPALSALKTQYGYMGSRL